MVYSPNRYGRYSKHGYGRPQRRSAAGQGGMRATYSATSQMVRHAVDQDLIYGATIADAKAEAYPLCVFNGLSGNTSADPTSSITGSIAEGSRVNHVQVQLQIAQSDPTKPNNCYVGFISTSFSDAMLDATNMTTNFGDLIAVSDAATGKMLVNNGAQDLTLKDYLENQLMRHWVKGLSRNAYTLYSGRPAVLNRVLPVPPKNRRGQFGSGWWLVIMNDSSGIQNETEGDATDVNVSFKTFFKEIQDVRAEVR